MSDQNSESEAPKNEQQIYLELVGRLLTKLHEAKTEDEREEVARDIFDIGVRTMAVTVGHELGNQLSPANSYLETLIGRKDLPDEEKAELLVESYESVHSTSDLIVEITRISKPVLREYGNLKIIKIDRPIIGEDDGI